MRVFSVQSALIFASKAFLQRKAKVITKDQHIVIFVSGQEVASLNHSSSSECDCDRLWAFVCRIIIRLRLQLFSFRLQFRAHCLYL